MNANRKFPVIGILGTNGTVSRSVESAGRALTLVGSNTGNLIYHFGADRNIHGPKLHFALGSEDNLAEIRRTIDILHIPAANQLNPEFDLTAWADAIEFLDKPIFIAGLGMQCELSEEEIVLKPGTVRFIDCLKRLAPGIGVRGETTRRLLERYGVKNVVVTGCPSNFINRNINGRTISAQLVRARGLSDPRIDFYPGTLSNCRTTESRLREFTAGPNTRYVLQTNSGLFEFVGGDTTNSKALAYLMWERSVLAPGMSQAEYNDIYVKGGAFYFSAPAWIDSVAQRDLGIGMRMHGIVATIQGGTAGVCVVSDGRIQELVETMGYPNVSIEDVHNSACLADVLQHVKFDAAVFDHKREKLFAAYQCLAHETGVSLSERKFLT